MGGDLEHGEVVERIAEDGVGMRKTDAAERCGFGRAGGDVDEFAGDEAVDDFDFGGEDALFGNAEVANAFRDDPLVGGTDGPELDVGFAQRVDEGGQLREDVGAYVLAEVAGSGGAQFLLAQASVDLNHFAADLSLVDLAGEVGAVAVVHPIGSGAGDEAVVDGPDHETVAGISTPQGSVAIEDSDLRSGFKDEMFELWCSPGIDFELCR